jgi:TRAP-type uncharacterized transport system substrate-binding protein
LGVSFDDFTPVYHSFEDGGKALEAGEVDGQWQCPYPHQVMSDLAARMDVCMLSYAPDDLAAVLGQINFYRPANVPAGFFRGVARATDQLAVVNIICAHKNTDAKTVRKFVKTILSNLYEIAGMNPLFAALADLFEPLQTEGSTALEFGGAPSHPGALEVDKNAGYLS